MRAFIVLGHKASLSPAFTLNDLPGSAGRLDVLCRCVNAGLFLSHDLRRDVTVHLILQDQFCVSISGKQVKRLNPDERSTGALIKKALEKIQTHSGGEPVCSTPGIQITRRGLARTLGQLVEQGFEPVLLHEDGQPLRQAALPERPVFVLSDHMDFSESELELLQGAPRLSVGPCVYPASHCIAVVNNEMDLRDSL